MVVDGGGVICTTSGWMGYGRVWWMTSENGVVDGFVRLIDLANTNEPLR